MLLTTGLNRVLMLIYLGKPQLKKKQLIGPALTTNKYLREYYNTELMIFWFIM
jgi:hypothetical protein